MSLAGSEGSCILQGREAGGEEVAIEEGGGHQQFSSLQLMKVMD